MSRGFAGTWLLLILWISMILCFYSFRRRNRGRMLTMLPVIGVSYYLLQVYCGDYGVTLSAGTVLPICLIASLIIAYCLYKELRWQRTHLSEMSVKNAIDALQTGICCYDEAGRVLLKNKTMEIIHRTLTGDALLNGNTFEQLIFSPEKGGETAMIIQPDGKVYEFRREELPGESGKKRKKEYVLTASEITEEYRKTQTLLEKQQTVTELNQRLREYNKEILSVITTKEVLNAKVKIHDELGASLLRVKKYLENVKKDENSEDVCRDKERQEILDSIRQNVTFLQREMSPNEEDEYTLLLKTAHQLDVQIEIEGKLPKEEMIREICVTALHECLTNTIRHAHGDLLMVSFTERESEFLAVYTNNGIAPSGEITEKGGLKSLRNLVEQEGGKMEIQTDGRFLLSLTLKK